MARIFLSYQLKVALPSGAAPQTLAQIIAGSNSRVALKSIELGPLGSTGASAPLEFDLAIQDGAGGMENGDVNGQLVKMPPVGGETLTTTVLMYNTTTEPTTSTVQQRFSLHQQGVRVWRPLGGELLILGGVRMGLRLITQGIAISYSVNFELEE